MQYHDVTLEKVTAALDANVLRALVINHNIARAHLRGFQPLEAEFYRRRQNLAGEKVNLPRQILELTRNEMAYRTLIKGLNQHFAVLKLAMTGG